MNHDDYDWNGNAVQLATSIFEDIEEDKRDNISRASALVAQGLRTICDSDESAVKVALTVCRLLAVLLSSELNEVADIADGTMVAYAIAGANLAGGFDLPEPPEPVINFIPDFLPPEWTSGL